MKRALWLFVAMIMVLSLALTSCGELVAGGNSNEGGTGNEGTGEGGNENPGDENPGDENPGDENPGEGTGEPSEPTTPEEDIETLVGILSGSKFDDIFDDFGNFDTPSAEEILEELSKVSFQVDLTNKTNGSNESMRLVVLNSIAYLLENDSGDEEWEVVGAFKAYETLLLALTFGVDNIEIGFVEIPELSEIFESESGIEPASYMEELSGFDFNFDIDTSSVPTISASDFEKKGDWYVLNEDYIKEVVRAYLEVLLESMENIELPDIGDEGELPAIDSETIESMIDLILTNVTIDLGFRVNGENISAIKYYVEIEDSFFATMAVAGLTIASDIKNCGFGIEAYLDDSCTYVKTMNIDAKVDYKSGTDLVYSADYATVENEEGAPGLDITVETIIPAKTMESLMDLIKSLESGEDTVADEGTVYYDTKITESVKLDLSKLETAGATVIDVDVLVAELDAAGALVETLLNVDVSLINDENAVGILNVLISEGDGEDKNDFAVIEGIVHYNEAANLPEVSTLASKILEGAEELYATLNAIGAEYTFAEEESYITVLYNDAALGATILFDIDNEGDGEYGISAVYAYESQPLYAYYDYVVTVGTDGYVFTPAE